MFTSRIARSSTEASFCSTIRRNRPDGSRTIRPNPCGSTVTAVPTRQEASSWANRSSSPRTLPGRSIGESPQTITTGRRPVGRESGLDSVRRGRHRVACAALLPLNRKREPGDVGQARLDQFGAVTDDDDHLPDACRAEGVDDPADERLPGRLMDDLRQVAPHPCSLARGEYHGDRTSRGQWARHRRLTVWEGGRETLEKEGGKRGKGPLAIGGLDRWKM